MSGALVPLCLFHHGSLQYWRESQRPAPGAGLRDHLPCELAEWTKQGTNLPGKQGQWLHALSPSVQAKAREAWLGGSDTSGHFLHVGTWKLPFTQPSLWAPGGCPGPVSCRGPSYLLYWDLGGWAVLVYGAVTRLSQTALNGANLRPGSTCACLVKVCQWPRALLGGNPLQNTFK